MTRFNRIAALAFVSLFVAGASPLHAAGSLLNWTGQEPFKIYHVYTASDNKSYIEEIAKTGRQLFDFEKALYIHLATSHPHELGDWHYAGHRHLIIAMQGDSRFDTGDGAEHLVHPGEAILIEDWVGKGHRWGCDVRNKVDCVFVDVMIGENDKTLPLRDPPR